MKRNANGDIQRRLDDYRKLLDSCILISLRKHYDMLSIQQDKSFQNLDQKVQILITNLAQVPKHLDEMKFLISKESELVKQHITNEFHQ